MNVQDKSKRLGELIEKVCNIHSYYCKPQLASAVFKLDQKEMPGNERQKYHKEMYESVIKHFSESERVALRDALKRVEKIDNGGEDKCALFHLHTFNVLKQSTIEIKALVAEVWPNHNTDLGYLDAYSLMNFRNDQICENLRVLKKRLELIAPKQNMQIESSTPLPRRAKLVFDLLNSLPIGDAMTGDDIINRIYKDHNVLIDESTLTKNIIPLLKESRNVQNRRGAGYYVIK